MFRVEENQKSEETLLDDEDCKPIEVGSPDNNYVYYRLKAVITTSPSRTNSHPGSLENWPCQLTRKQQYPSSPEPRLWNQKLMQRPS